ncbi:hypothetical protein A2U01_0070700, partial [Trifolium medium]|nr:hypothetical protein [Trifolium medium]
MSSPPPQRSIADLEKLMDERHNYNQTRFDDLAAHMGTGFDSLRQMILNQPNHSDHGNYNGRPPGTPSPE